MTDNIANPGASSRIPLIRPVQTPPAPSKSKTTTTPERQPHIRAATDLPAVTTTASDPEADIFNEAAPATSALTSNWWQRAGFLKWSLLAAGVLLVLLLSIETLVLINEMLDFNSVLATVLIITLSVFLGAIVLALLREYQQLRALRSLSRLRDQGERLLNSSSYGGAANYLSEVRTLYGQRQELAEVLAEYERHQHQHRSDADEVRQLSASLGNALDRQAQRLIASYVRKLAVWTALNPLALLDSLIVLWLTLKMVRDIAAIYGGRPGITGSWKLLREIALLVAATGATDLLADSATDTIGVGIAGMLSTRLAQGIVTGLFVARIGLYALKLCRPIPFESEKDSLWKGLRQEVFKIFDR